MSIDPSNDRAMQAGPGVSRGAFANAQITSVPLDTDATFVQRADGTLVEARLPGGAALGWRREQLEGVGVVDLIHPDDRLIADRGRVWCHTTGKGQTISIRLRAPGGRWGLSEIAFERIELDDGTLGTVAAVRDVLDLTMSAETLGFVLALRSSIEAAPNVDDALRHTAARLVQWLQLDRAYVWRMADGVPTPLGAVGAQAAPPAPYEERRDAALLSAFGPDGATATPTIGTSRNPHVATDVHIIRTPVVTDTSTLAVIEFESAVPLVGLRAVEVARSVLDRLADAFARKEVEQELDLARQQLAVAFNEAPVGMALIDVDARVSRVNRALTELANVPDTMLVQRRLFDLLHPDDVGEQAARLDELLAGDADSYQHEVRILRPDRSVVWTLLSVSVVRAGDGVASQFIAQLSDISSQKYREFQLGARHRDRAVDPLEALDAFLQSQPTGAQIGLIRVRFEVDSATMADDVGGLQAAIDRLQAATRADDHFVQPDPTHVLVFVAELSPDSEVSATQLASIRERIETRLRTETNEASLVVDAEFIDPVHARARDLLARRAG